MPPENESQQRLPAISSSEDEWDGPWGSISPVSQSVETLCVEVESRLGYLRIHFYPYRTIGKWTWATDQPEILTICIGGTQVTISGSGLRRLAEALKLGQLKRVRYSFQSIYQGDIDIRAIRIEDEQ
jgi:hypothetical protein